MKHLNHTETLVKKRSIVIILLFLFLTFFCAILLIRDKTLTSGDTVLITQNGTVIKEINLTTLTAPVEFRIDGDNGLYNIVRVTRNGASIIEANCPDKLCVHMGEIHNSHIPITCLPNKVVVEISRQTDTATDAVSY